MDAAKEGEKCAKSMILELAETNICNVIDCPPGEAK